MSIPFRLCNLDFYQESTRQSTEQSLGDGWVTLLLIQRFVAYVR